MGAQDVSGQGSEIVAVFVELAAAERARDALLQAGVPEGAIELFVRDGTPGPAAPERDESFWAAVRSLFVAPDEMTPEGARDALLMVTPGAGVDRARAVEILEENEPVDFAGTTAAWREVHERPAAIPVPTGTMGDIAAAAPRKPLGD